MNNKIQEMANALKSNQEIVFLEGAFRLFIDNAISEEELKELLKTDNYYLPDYFSKLSVREKKTYINHYQTRIYFENGEERYYWYQIFNNPYFYNLCDKARKNKTLTQQLIKYVVEIGYYNVPLFFLGAQYIRLNNTQFALYNQIFNYYSKYKINNLYDLIVSLFSNPKKEVEKTRNYLIDKIKSENIIGFDLDLPFCKFALLIECILSSSFSSKESNTIKIKFRILKNEYLRDIDYYSDPKMQNAVINNFKKRVNDNKILLKNVFNFVNKNKSDFDTFPPNGYSAIYYYLMEEKHG